MTQASFPAPRLPAYDRKSLTPGIVHIGLGNFHRAHLQVYLDRLMNAGRDRDWAIIGGLTGVMVALVPFDWQVHDTHFVVAHLHYVLIGGMVFPLFAALYHWLPLASGRMASPRLASLGFCVSRSSIRAPRTS